MVVAAAISPESLPECQRQFATEGPANCIWRRVGGRTGLCVSVVGDGTPIWLSNVDGGNARPVRTRSRSLQTLETTLR